MLHSDITRVQDDHFLIEVHITKGVEGTIGAEGGAILVTHSLT
jgi:hypothetical protein